MPLVRPFSASTPWCSHFRLSPATIVRLGASGALSKQVTNMSRGFTAGSGTTSYGRWRSLAHSPDSSSSARVPLPVSNLRFCPLPSGSITIERILRRSPRTTLAIFPLTGEVTLMASTVLS